MAHISNSDRPSNSRHPRSSTAKAASNRRNAAKSTGPRTPQGKAHSRLNALKHGILASQTVIATIEGRAERKMFEAMVDGLSLDFHPVGTYEQLLVQEIAACFWRQRRLLRFESRAAFEVREQRCNVFLAGSRAAISEHTAPYLLDERLSLADDVYRAAGLDAITIPGEADLARAMRYEAAINRTRERAVASLAASKKARRADPSGQRAPVIVDREGAQRNARRTELMVFPPIAAVRVWDAFSDAQQERFRAEEAKIVAEVEAAAAAADQTKPKNLDEISRKERLERKIREVFGNHDDSDEPGEEPKKPSSD